MKIKRLSLESWMIDQDCYPYTSINTIGRDGWYLYDGVSWVEERGKSFYYRVDMFKHTLNTLNAGEYNYREINALRSVVREGVATKKQRDSVYCRDHYEELRRIRRGK